MKAKPLSYLAMVVGAPLCHNDLPTSLKLIYSTVTDFSLTHMQGHHTHAGIEPLIINMYNIKSTPGLKQPIMYV